MRQFKCGSRCDMSRMIKKVITEVPTAINLSSETYPNSERHLHSPSPRLKLSGTSWPGVQAWSNLHFWPLDFEESARICQGLGSALTMHAMDNWDVFVANRKLQTLLILDGLRKLDFKDKKWLVSGSVTRSVGDLLEIWVPTGRVRRWGLIRGDPQVLDNAILNILNTLIHRKSAVLSSQNSNDLVVLSTFREEAMGKWKLSVAFSRSLHFRDPEAFGA